MLASRYTALCSYHVARPILLIIFFRNIFTYCFNFFGTKVDLVKFLHSSLLWLHSQIRPLFLPWRYNCCELWSYVNLCDEIIPSFFGHFCELYFAFLFCFLLNSKCSVTWGENFPVYRQTDRTSKNQIRRPLFNTCTTSHFSREFPSLRLSPSKQSLILPHLRGAAVQTTADYLKC